MSQRKIINRLSAVREDIGTLVTRTPPAVLAGPSPFLHIAHHGPQLLPPHNHGMPFAPHPHRGFETISFIRQGAMLHEDNRGGPQVVHAGGVQWMTAGSGIVHNESATPEMIRDGGPLEVLQLWLNLPARLKSSPPAYTGLEAADIPAISDDDGKVTVHLIAGTFGGETGPVQSLTGTTMLTLDFEPGGNITLPVPVGRDLFLYVVAGEIMLGKDRIAPFTRVEFDHAGDKLEVSAPGNASVIIGHAPLIHEPVAAHGPFVMNTGEEIMQAIRDYQAGRFA